MVNGIREAILVAVIALIISALIKTFLAQAFVIPSQSMENTLQKSDRVMVTKVGGYQRGDVVVFQDSLSWLPPEPPPTALRKGLEFVGVLPASGSQYLIKRLIGLPGDRVICCDQAGRITVNGVPLEEASYLYTDRNGTKVKPSEMAFDVIVPAGRIFVMGDHRNQSADSRYHLCDATDGKPAHSNAFPPVASIQGPAKIIVFPFERVTTLGTPDTFAHVPAPSGTPPAEPVVALGGC